MKSTTSGIAHLIFRGVLAPVLFVAMLASPASAAGDGRIAGTITNATHGQPASGLEVTLSRFENNPPQLISETPATTDSNGSFEFSGLDAAEGIVYVVSVEYLGVLYSSGMIRLWEQPDTRSDMSIYETTTDQSALRLQSRGIVLSSIDAQNGSISVLDVFAFSLTDSRTIVPGDDGRTLRFSVPANASEVTPLAGFDFGTPSIEGTTVFATSAITPGSPTATLGYTIPYQGSAVSIDVSATYPTESVRVLVPVASEQLPQQVVVEAEGATDQGEVTVGDRAYHLWTLPAVGADERITLTLADLPRFDPRQNELPRTAPIVLALVALVVAASVTAWVVVKRRLYRPRPVRLLPALAVPLEQRQQELSEELRALEAAHNADGIDQTQYVAARRAILEELRWLSRQARGLGADE